MRGSTIRPLTRFLRSVSGHAAHEVLGNLLIYNGQMLLNGRNF